MPLALVRPPGPALAAGLVTHIERRPVDAEVALRQWHGYVAAMAEAGWDIAEVAPADDCPDAVFVEDALVMFDDLCVIASPAAPSRAGEIAGAEAAVAGIGVEVHRLAAPATLDGGDVLKVGRLVYVGVGGRTNARAVAELAFLLAPRGWEVRPVPVHKVLHLKSAVTALPDGTVIGYPELVDDVGAFGRFLAVPEPAGAHVVLLGDDRLLMAAGAPGSADLFRSMGYRTVEVDIGEFEKLEGCVTCLSVRVRR
ncbi:MAG TPA: N(G),N(G)-dimethylarginine dimethylaminohydrolase [Ilumatobacter sp.]